MKLLLILIICSPIITTAQKITGNVFYKYNEFVGNRADAGASVTLQTYSSKEVNSTKVDLSGNFEFTDLQNDSTYILIIKSKKNTSEPLSTYFNLLKANSIILKGTNYNLELHEKEIQNQINQSFIDQREEDEKNKGKKQNYKNLKNNLERSLKYEKKRNDLASTFINELPIFVKLFISIATPFDKLYIEEIKLKDTYKVIVDFGITYM